MTRVRHAPWTALVVDPDPGSNLRTADVLRRLGFASLWRTTSIRQSLRFCAATPFDVAIIELELGNEDGGHLIKALRGWPGAVDRTIAVAANRQVLEAARKDRVPANAFVLKPLFEHVLRPHVGKCSQRGNAATFDDASNLVELD